MNVAVIGSHALKRFGLTRKPMDLDIVGEYDDLVAFMKSEKAVSIYPSQKGKKLIGKGQDLIIEGEIDWGHGSTNELLKIIKEDDGRIISNGILYPSLNILYTLKMSHRFLKNSPHFYKTMKDIRWMREMGAKIPDEYMGFFKRREKETYAYNHPKLNVTKADFFKDDNIKYVYDHDDIHIAVKNLSAPAYTFFKKEGSEVECSKEMFFTCSEETRLYAVLEEAYVLALERSIIPFGDSVNERSAFNMALMKICTSITSGWFREFAWENHDKVSALYNPLFKTWFFEALSNGKVKPFTTPYQIKKEELENVAV